MFGNELKKARLAKQLSGRKTAELAGISSPYYSQIETGKRPKPPRAVVKRLEQVLQTKFANKQAEPDPASIEIKQSKLDMPAHLLTPRERSAQYAAVAFDAACTRRKSAQFETLMQHVAGVVSSAESYDWHNRELSNIIEEHFPKRTNEKETK